MGGHLSNPIVRALEEGLNAGGIATLAFNWRGVGGSEGRPSGDGPDAVADYTSAHRALTNAVTTPSVAAGYSFGSIAAIRYAIDCPDIDLIVLASPPADWLEPLPLETYPHPVLAICGSCDEFSPIAQLEAQIKRLPAGRLEVIEGADHFFSTGGSERIPTLVADIVAEKAIG